MLSAMEIIGERFKDGTVFIPEVLLSARALNEALKIKNSKHQKTNNK
jgi:methanogenic corrinoid protein MtbC1